MKTRGSMRLCVALALMLVLGACAQANFRQPAAAPPRESDLATKAVVVVTADTHEQTSLRDISTIGSVLFRKLDEAYASRAADDYDFGIVGSVGADWQAKFGGPDDNRAPHVFVIEPGTYVLEKVRMGRAPSTKGPGYDPARARARFGVFSVRAGDVVNLGRLVIYMYWYQGYFTARTHDNTDEARATLRQISPGLDARLESRLLYVTSTMAFE